jgi:hypothetical protein
MSKHKHIYNDRGRCQRCTSISLKATWFRYRWTLGVVIGLVIVTVGLAASWFNIRLALAFLVIGYALLIWGDRGVKKDKGHNWSGQYSRINRGETS